MTERNVWMGVAIISVLGLIYYKRVYRYQKMKSEALNGIKIKNKKDL